MSRSFARKSSICGLSFVQADHWTPFVPPNQGSFGELASAASSAAPRLFFYSYIGFDAVSAMSQETRNAQRVVPWALIASLAVCTVLYVLIALMVTGLADYRALGVPAWLLLGAAVYAGYGFRHSSLRQARATQ